MAILRSGILGHTSGKVAGVVGGKWKDKSYIREYVIPANPNTTPQQEQRSKMSDCVAFAKGIVGQIFNQYVDKFQKSMSGFNYFISQNIAIFDGSPAWNTIVITFGKLWKATLTGAVKASDVITLAWDPTSVGNNGSTADRIYGAVYDTVTGLWYFPSSEVDRSVGTMTVTVPAASAAGDYMCFLFASKYSLTSPTLLEMVSDSTALAASN